MSIIIQILYAYFPNFVKIVFKYCHILPKYFQNNVQILFKYFPKHCPYYVQILYEYFPNFKYCPNVIQMLFKYHLVIVQILSVSKQFLLSADGLRYSFFYIKGLSIKTFPMVENKRTLAFAKLVFQSSLRQKEQYPKPI